MLTHPLTPSRNGSMGEIDRSRAGVGQDRGGQGEVGGRQTDGSSLALPEWSPNRRQAGTQSLRESRHLGDKRRPYFGVCRQPRQGGVARDQNPSPSSSVFPGFFRVRFFLHFSLLPPPYSIHLPVLLLLFRLTSSFIYLLPVRGLLFLISFCWAFCFSSS